MQEVTTTKAVEEACDFELGMMLGTRKAFASVAGRCSAADAECLRRLREKKTVLEPRRDLGRILSQIPRPE
jgi:hypothetical protein